ncbi:MAG: GTP cyclohydrolase I [Chitinophagaceae bacterium]
MKQNGNMITLNGNGKDFKEPNRKHFALSLEKLLNTNELMPDDNTKIKLISSHFKQIMLILGLDMNDDSLKGTPDRVAKMYVKEIFSGLNADNKPNVTLFENKYSYNEMLVEKNITVYSCCEHHFVPIIGKVYIPEHGGSSSLLVN